MLVSFTLKDLVKDSRILDCEFLILQLLTPTILVLLRLNYLEDQLYVFQREMYNGSQSERQVSGTQLLCALRRVPAGTKNTWLSIPSKAQSPGREMKWRRLRSWYVIVSLCTCVACTVVVPLSVCRVVCLVDESVSMVMSISSGVHAACVLPCACRRALRCTFPFYQPIDLGIFCIHYI